MAPFPTACSTIPTTTCGFVATVTRCSSASPPSVSLAGEIIAFTAKPRGADVARGRGLGTVESRKTVLAVHSPISFTLLDMNEALEERLAPINAAPYAAWLVRVRPQDWDADRERLVDAAAYRAHILAIEPKARFA